MTKEQFERAKAIEEELIHLRVAMDSLRKYKLNTVAFEGCKVDLTAIAANYVVRARALLIDRKKTLQNEFKTL